MDRSLLRPPGYLNRIPDFLALMRLDRPIGTWLLMWPTLWALWVASEGIPARDTLLIFVAGVYLMRAAGCVVNDYADRHFDGHVKRTKNRPLATGRISEREAKVLFVCLLGSAFALVWLTNGFTVWLSLIGAVLAASYPFMKRYTHFPQVVLGAAFSWAIPMAFGAVLGEVPMVAWLLFTANVLWTVAYDTEYAMVDRDDDLKIGIKSTAVLFGRWDTRIIALLQLATLGLLAWAGSLLALGGFFWLGWLAMGATFVHQQRLIKSRDRDRCFQAFLNNHWSGLLLFAGLGLSLYPSLG
ncbi:MULTISPECIES: 4-hydroxybenzoate octaprenyltransferase [unclassified Halomonas]|uniref:4-hydroxybenzoate octaprenyltransferase n=1 Tax=unclassified Halomonas TaxID=2609666 RepID=UPI0005F9FADD|nr:MULTISPECIES: 4-hydroxybenzoate octaprenyltransferase [unclassified Halomonas]MBR9879317.1 4-hydroxybenzoate octaprenyltransferase [Gammaproteobacteria bacterium]KJZ17249.1 4-hydroxybenzoate polyprenyltransferase [Halomonas sp. S2151]MAR74744.1 4-hydroxybenzoate octaprenyltransferase [Halomonas sp.]MAY70577.1 4-hydroxybenzoate octaprenyltransferase [Halomonas sp.]MCJ8284929.1 4-hydroxybenzoate octaprenyltransferase [Halomonas sp.]|tara:strand:- start:1591 stop:2484 length:894 start_codon:yes stop_codon:yes gene_type:complete